MKNKKNILILLLCIIIYIAGIILSESIFTGRSQAHHTYMLMGICISAMLSCRVCTLMSTLSLIKRSIIWHGVASLLLFGYILHHDASDTFVWITILALSVFYILIYLRYVKKEKEESYYNKIMEEDNDTTNEDTDIR